MPQHASFCRLCFVGCGLTVEATGGRITSVKGDKRHPLSRGYLCPKGLAAGSAHNNDKRLDAPLMRSGSQMETVSWDDALDSIGDSLSAIEALHGPDAIGFYMGTAGMLDSGAQLAREFAAQLKSSSWYSSTSVDAAGWLFVAERMSCNPWLLPQPDSAAELVVLIGINPLVSHGHNYYTAAPKAVLRNWASRKGLWVIDPRRTETAEVASHHLRPVPGSEFALLAYLVKMLLREGADEDYIRDHGLHRDRLARAVDGFTREAAIRATGIAGEQIDLLLASIRSARRVAVHSGTGISMSRNANVTTWLIWVLNIITGSMDRPGGMWINRGMMRDMAQQGWEAANTTEPGPRSRPDLPRRCGEMPSAAIVDEIEAGNLRALLVIGGNPLIALPEAPRLERALRSLELLVVLDVVPTGTTACATHVLPCAGQFERSDMSLSEIVYPLELTQFTPAIFPPQAERKPSWWILGQLARRMGLDIAPQDPAAQNDVAMTRKVAAHPRFDVDALTAGEARWHHDERRSWGWVAQHLPGKRWDLAPQELVDQLDLATVATRRQDEFFLLNGRQRHKVNSTLNDGMADPHGRSMPGLYMHMDDAKRLGLAQDASARVTSRAGVLTVNVMIDDGMMPGCVSLPHGFEHANVGDLTSALIDIDTKSGMPTLTGLKLYIERVV